MSKLNRFASGLFFTSVAFLILASSALADAVHTSPVLTASSKQTWAILIGALVPLGTYVLNHVGPWVSEPTKALVTVLISALAGALYTALATSSFGLNSATVEMVLTTIVSTLGAHAFLWRPSTISTRLGGGSNASGHAGHRLRWVSDPAPATDPAPPTTPPAA